MLELRCEAFVNGKEIPNQYTCDAQEQFPSLKWENAPEGTKSFVLIMDDPDAPAGTWVHLILFNIPAEITEIKDLTKLPETVQFGLNSWGESRYGHICPPHGMPHRYFFKLYALETMLPLQTGVTKETLEQTFHGHVLASAEIYGTYQRRQV